MDEWDKPEQWERAERVGRVVLAAEGLGTAARALELGVAYAKERESLSSTRWAWAMVSLSSQHSCSNRSP